jgi:hypothetical protein
VRKNVFDVPHPIGLIVAGLVFIFMGLILPQALGPAGQRAVIDPFTEFAPTTFVLIVMVGIGLWFIAQGVITLIRRRK